MKRVSIKLRPASPRDARRLFLWRNQPSTRRNSFHAGRVLWKEHLDWLQKRLADPGCRLYILCYRDGKALGQFRLDRVGRLAIVSVGLGGRYQGKGLGAESIRLGTHRGLSDLGLRHAVALVKVKNAASRRAFEKADYHFEKRVSVAGQKALRMLFKA